MMQEHLFKPILNIVIETMPRDNLLNSACLEFFEYIKAQSISPLITHLVENYREEMKTITYVDTFSWLLIRHDHHHGLVPNVDGSFRDTEEDSPQQAELRRGDRWRQGIKDLDPTEEEYFNTSDDEEDTPSESSSSRASMNGASPLKPLVDYPSDEENENMDTEPATTSLHFKSKSPESTTTEDSDNAGILTPTSSSAPAPPERLSEKRRREEDDEDELGKLAQPKRRNSSSSVISNSSSSLRRKKSLINNSHGSGAGAKSNKIAISLVTSINTSDESRGSNENIRLEATD
jgi:protein phosphatase-4 regulatory subunit 3